MLTRRFRGGWSLGSALLLLGLWAGAAPQADPAVIAGEWDLELDAEGQLYYLILTIETVDGRPAGKVAEASGYFSDVPLTDVAFDGTNFSFKFEAPTPPDGMDRVVAGKFELVEGKLEGFINVDELGISAPAVGTRK